MNKWIMLTFKNTTQHPLLNRRILRCFLNATLITAAIRYCCTSQSKILYTSNIIIYQCHRKNQLQYTTVYTVVQFGESSQ